MFSSSVSRQEKSSLQVYCIFFCFFIPFRENRCLNKSNWWIQRNLYPPFLIELELSSANYSAEQYTRHSLLYVLENVFGTTAHSFETSFFILILRVEVVFTIPSSHALPCLVASSKAATRQ